MGLNLERNFGPLSLRAWGLVVNFSGNAIALYGLASVLRDEGGWIWIWLGAGVTLACLLTLARPSED